MKKNMLRIVLLLVVSINCMAHENVSFVGLKNQNDSVNYALGLANGDGIKKHYFKNLPTEQAIAQFMENLERTYLSGKNEIINKDSTNEFFTLNKVGIKVGSALKQQLITGLMGFASIKVDFALIKRGLQFGMDMKATEGLMKLEDALDYLPKVIKKLEDERLTPEDRSNKIAGEEFLAMNKKRPEIKTTITGLQYEIINSGTGPVPGDSSNVKVLYYGTLIDGTMFDSSDKHNKSETFAVSKVLKGWKEILELMPVGSIFKIYVPQELAYGNSLQGIVKPYSALIYEIRLMGIE